MQYENKHVRYCILQRSFFIIEDLQGDFIEYVTILNKDNLKFILVNLIKLKQTTTWLKSKFHGMMLFRHKLPFNDGSTLDCTTKFRHGKIFGVPSIHSYCIREDFHFVKIYSNLSKISWGSFFQCFVKYVPWPIAILLTNTLTR